MAGLTDFTKVKDAVCLILVESPSKFKATGFHYGNGWVMTNAHALQNDASDQEDEHSVLSSGKFRVRFDIDGKKYEFKSGHRRMAFVHHLQPGEYTDFKNKDIAMLKLGIQYGYGRKSSDHWEEEEKRLLDEMASHHCGLGLAQCYAPEFKKDDKFHAVHYGGNNHEKKHEEVTIKRITAGKDRVPMLHLKKEEGVLAEGSSGCPIMLEKDGKYYLVGLHFSGDDDDTDGEAEALTWNKGIEEYIGNGVEIIAGSERYMTYSDASLKLPDEFKKGSHDWAMADRKSLFKNAEENNLTIYLSNGEVIKGKSEKNCCPLICCTLL